RAAPPAWLQNRNKPIAEVIEAYLAWGNASGGTGGRPWSKQNACHKKTYLGWWVERLGLKVLADITLSHVEEALRELAATGLAPKSVYLRMEALRCLCHWSIKRGFLNENPLRGMAAMNTRPQQPHRPLTQDEVGKLLSSCESLHRI